MNFFKGYELDMHFYLLKSLKKMVLSIQSSRMRLERSFFHFVLVNILVEARLKEKNYDWEQFLILNCFVKARV